MKSVRQNEISWNVELKLAISDVDDTIAEVHTPATPEMIDALNSFLRDGYCLFLVTGGDIKRVTTQITDKLDPALRQYILVAHCSGAEVWGFHADGSLRDAPFYSEYEVIFTEEKKLKWREVMEQLVTEFNIHKHPMQNKNHFWGTVGRHPLDMFYDDRGPQITISAVNATDLSEDASKLFGHEIPLVRGKRDVRYALQVRARQLLSEHSIPVSANFGGTCSLDFAVDGVSKTTTVQKVLASEEILKTCGLNLDDVARSSYLEVWGDKYEIHHGGTDRFISMALPRDVRSIDFRDEDPSDFVEGYNIVLWNGKKRLCEGLLEYLLARKQ